MNCGDAVARLGAGATADRTLEEAACKASGRRQGGPGYRADLVDPVDLGIPYYASFQVNQNQETAYLGDDDDGGGDAAVACLATATWGYHQEPYALEVACLDEDNDDAVAAAEPGVGTEAATARER